jgi:hypothetical protein
MDSDGEELSSSDESANMLFEDLGDEVAMQALLDERTELAAIDSGANKLIVTRIDGIENLQYVNNEFLSTASRRVRLPIVARGRIGRFEVLFCPDDQQPVMWHTQLEVPLHGNLNYNRLWLCLRWRLNICLRLEQSKN